MELCFHHAIGPVLRDCLEEHAMGKLARSCRIALDVLEKRLLKRRPCLQKATYFLR